LLFDLLFDLFDEHVMKGDFLLLFLNFCQLNLGHVSVSGCPDRALVQLGSRIDEAHWSQGVIRLQQVLLCCFLVQVVFPSHLPLYIANGSPLTLRRPQ